MCSLGIQIFILGFLFLYVESHFCIYCPPIQYIVWWEDKNIFHIEDFEDMLA
jgi:hypothetical protein